jgi:hypothetical protein
VVAVEEQIAVLVDQVLEALEVLAVVEQVELQQ